METKCKKSFKGWTSKNFFKIPFLLNFKASKVYLKICKVLYEMSIPCIAKNLLNCIRTGTFASHVHAPERIEEKALN